MCHQQSQLQSHTALDNINTVIIQLRLICVSSLTAIISFLCLKTCSHFSNDSVQSIFFSILFTYTLQLLLQ
jgi:hypothetical protein